MEEKQELKFDNLRELCLKLNELILRPGIELAESYGGEKTTPNLR